jgi:signal transduction histidine kinase
MRLRGPWPVRLRLILAFLLVGVPPMLAASYLASTLIAGAFEKNVGQWLSETTQFVTLEITEREGDAAQIAAPLRAAASQAAGEASDPTSVALKVYQPLLSAVGFDVMIVYDSNRTIHYSTLPFVPTKALPKAMTRAIFAGTLDGRPVLVAGAIQPFSTNHGDFFLFLGDALDSSSFSSLKVVPSLQLEFFAVKDERAVKLYETSKLEAAPSKDMIRQLASAAEPILLNDPPGDLFQAAITGLRDQDGDVSGVVFCGVGNDEFIGQDKQLHLLWAVFLVGGLIFVTAGALVAARLVKPLRALSRAVRSVAAGDFSQRVPETGDKETVELASHFNAMAGELEEARAREAEMRRKERLSTLGEAAMAIAHEVRNPLGIIKTSSDLVRARAKLGPKEEQLLDYVTEEVHRIDNLLTQVLDFAHPKEPRHSIFDPREIVERMRGFLDPEITRKGLALSMDDRAGGAKVSADRDQIYEAVLNLVINAMDAISPGGRIVVRLDSTGDTVSIEVADSGPGVRPELRGRIFNPFFTTKAKGTGLGLAKVATVVEAHHGKVEYLPEPRGGACFRMTLPRAGSKTGPAAPSTKRNSVAQDERATS